MSFNDMNAEDRDFLDFCLNNTNCFTYEFEAELRDEAPKAHRYLSEVRPFWRVLEDRLRLSFFPCVKADEVSPGVLESLAHIGNAAGNNLVVLDPHIEGVSYKVNDFVRATFISLQREKPLAIELMPFRREKVMKLAVNRFKYDWLESTLPALVELFDNEKERYSDGARDIMGSKKKCPWPRFRAAMMDMALEYDSSAGSAYVARQEELARM